jgi:hypothetical protein
VWGADVLQQAIERYDDLVVGVLANKAMCAALCLVMITACSFSSATQTVFVSMKKTNGVYGLTCGSCILGTLMPHLWLTYHSRSLAHRETLITASKLPGVDCRKLKIGHLLSIQIVERIQDGYIDCIHTKYRRNTQHDATTWHFFQETRGLRLNRICSWLRTHTITV